MERQARIENLMADTAHKQQAHTYVPRAFVLQIVGLVVGAFAAGGAAVGGVVALLNYLGK